jgi:hypothetical protein
MKKELLLLGVTLIIILSIFEISLYSIGYNNQYGIPKGLIIKDDYLDFVLKPNFEKRIIEPDYEVTIKTNNDGFMDYNHNLSNNKFKIMALGDSQAFGTGIELEKTFLYLLERKMDVEIFKMGIFGYGTDNEFRLYKKYYEKYKPNAVMLIIHPNDILDNAIWGEETPDMFFRFFHIHSYLRKTIKTYDFIYIRIENLKIFSWLKDKTELPGNYRALFSNGETKFTSLGWNNTKFYLNEFKKESKERNFTLIMVLATSLHQIDSDGNNLTKVNEKLKVYLNDTFFIDTYQTFKGRKDLFLPIDGHWNEEGHREVAELIYKNYEN